MSPSFGFSSRLENIVCGWKGGARGLTLLDLHQECLGAASGANCDLVPAALKSVRGLDRESFKRAQFRAAPVGRFDCALVPRPARGGRKEWLFVVEEELPLADQIALYGHAIGHLLLNRDAALLGQPLPLNVFDERAHADSLAELRLLENTRDLLNQRVLSRFPRLAELLVPRQWADVSAPASLRERIAAASWPAGLLFYGHEFTQGRVFITPEGTARGRKSRVDVLLRADASLPLAVAMAIRPRQDFEAAAQNLIHAARDQMGLPFGFLIEENGPVYEWDWTPGQSGQPTKRAQFPGRDELITRFLKGEGLESENERRTLLAPYTPSYLDMRRYYQERAINRAIIAVLQAKKGLRNKRILLNLATGTGKTPVAAQIAYKLKNRAASAVRNILFLTDRDFLLGQAQERHFERFGDARARVLGARDTVHDVLFSTYQALSGDKERAALYLEYPSNWFDLIFIDECHRGSADDDSNWHKILKHFESAIQIGMTATPLKNDNAQTYDYFGPPVATYSLRQGISDGFLAPYLVRRVEIGDQNTIQETQPAEINGAALGKLPLVSAKTLEAATDVIAKHLCDTLRRTDPMEKTIVFCCDQKHATRMRDAIALEMPDMVAKFENYTRRITADDLLQGKKDLGVFCNVEEASPVVVTTSRLLSTGVDVETCKNVVIARPVGSFVEFKQILGRGTRLHEPQKSWFTLIDYAGTIKHFFDADFDGYPEVVGVEMVSVQPAPDATEVASDAPPLFVTVISSDDSPALVEALIESSEALPPDAELSEPDSEPNFVALGEDEMPAPTTETPESEVEVTADASPATPTVVSGIVAPVFPDATAPSIAPPADATPVATATGRVYQVAGEWLYELAPDGKTLRTLRYADYARDALAGDMADEQALRERWIQRESRDEMLAVLRDQGVLLPSLAKSVGEPGADPLDLLAHVLFEAPLLTRTQRADAFDAKHAGFLAGFAPPARLTLEALLQKYRAGFADDLSDSNNLTMLSGDDLPKTLPMIAAFGGGDAMRAALLELEKRLYDL